MEQSKILISSDGCDARQATDDEIMDAAISIQKKKITSLLGVPDAIDYFFRKIHNKKREHFACVFIDNQNKPISFKIMFKGTTSSCYVSPGDIIKKAVSCDATGIVVAHNHPGGGTVPSVQDKELTKTLKTVCDCIEIRMLDHIIIGRNSHEYFSFREAGMV